MQLKYIMIFCFVLWFTKSKGQTKETQVKNLVAFAKLAGDIRYFSPTDASHQLLKNLGWDRVFINGVQSALNSPTHRSFADSLMSIFKPIEPSLFLSYQRETLCEAPNKEMKGYVVSVQHRGLELYSGTSFGRAFNSIRTNRRSLLQDSKMSSATFINKILPERFVGQVFQIGINYDVKEDFYLKVLSKTANILLDTVCRGKGKILVRDTVNSLNNSVNMAIKFDEIDGAFSVDTMMVVGNEKLNLGTLEDANSDDQVTHELFLRANDKKIYDGENKIGDTLYSNLSSELISSFPLAVYATQEKTYPEASYIEEDYIFNKGAFNKYFDDRLLDRQSVRLANVIHIWNVFRYAYVYNNLSIKEEQDLLVKTLHAVLETKSVMEYYEVVWKMLSAYKDAHIFFNLNEIDLMNKYTIPISIIQIDGKYYVRNIHEDGLKSVVNIADEILQIDNEDIQEVVQRKSKLASGSKENINTRVVFSLFSGEKDGEVILKLRDSSIKKFKSIKINRNYQHVGPTTISTLASRNNRMLREDTYYFNLSESNITDTLLHFINDSTKNIVFDVRGYLTVDFEEKNILNKLISDTIEHNIFYSFDILSPQKRSFKGFSETSIPENSNQKARFYFLADHSTQSAPETLLDIIKYWNIGYIIGQPTAGANGNINYLSLPGNMSVTFSGLKTVNSDGTEHHLIGIEPDFLIDFSLNDIINRTDPYINKAMELIKSHMSK